MTEQTDPRPRTQQEATEASVLDEILGEIGEPEGLTEPQRYQAAASADFEAALSLANNGARTCWVDLLFGIEKAIADPEDEAHRVDLWTTLAQAQHDALSANDAVTKIRSRLDRAYQSRARAARLEAEAAARE
jgi:hypothetical protein